MDSARLTVLGISALGTITAAAALGYYAGRHSKKDSPTVIPVNDLAPGSKRYSQAEREARCNLAVLYRIVDNLGWSERIYNHISLRVPGEDEHFLINPYGLHYSEITASNLVKIDINGNIVDPGSTQLGINRAGYVIHSAIHRARKDIQCIIHVHTPVGGAVSSMKCGLLYTSMYPLGFGKIAYHDFQGVTTDEKERVEIVNNLGPTSKVMILRNHGLLAMGGTIPEAYRLLRDLMTACEIQIHALSGGIDNVIQFDPKEVRESENVSSEKLDLDELEFEQAMRDLDRKHYNTGYKYKLSSYTKQKN